jgi:hypothetical protein
MTIVRLLLGFLLLFFGRKLYWAFVAVAGFLLGMELAAELFAEQAEWVRMLIALAGGVIGAILGILFQRIAFAIGGLFAGGYLVWWWRAKQASRVSRSSGLPSAQFSAQSSQR